MRNSLDHDFHHEAFFTYEVITGDNGVLSLRKIDGEHGAVVAVCLKHETIVRASADGHNVGDIVRDRREGSCL